MSVGRKKPKFPFTSVTQSALLFVTIYLKAKNPAMTEYTRNKWTKILAEFNEDCDNISFLGRKMTRRYRAPSQVHFALSTCTPLTLFQAIARIGHASSSFLQPAKEARLYEKNIKLTIFLFCTIKYIFIK